MSKERVSQKAAQRVSWKIQTLQAVAAIVATVALPQLIHVFGMVTGLGTIPGAVLLPMHLPVMMVGILAGPMVGAATGLIGPLVSFALTGMPTLMVLPFMMVELCVYGLSAGLLRSTKLPTVIQVIVTQAAGRLARMAVLAIAIYGLGTTGVSVWSVPAAIRSGVPGILVQLVSLPLLVYLVKRRGQNE